MLSNLGIKRRTVTVRLEAMPTKQNENIAASRPGIDIAVGDLIVSHPKIGTRERRASGMVGSY